MVSRPGGVSSLGDVIACLQMGTVQYRRKTQEPEEIFAHTNKVIQQVGGSGLQYGGGLASDRSKDAHLLQQRDGWAAWMHPEAGWEIRWRGDVEVVF